MNLDEMLFGSNPPAARPTSGNLLIASPLLNESVFTRAVILLIDNDAKGGNMGLIVNLMTKLKMRDLLPDMESIGDCDIYCGGPVDCDRLFMLHRLGKLISGSVEVTDGLYVGGDLEDLHFCIDSGIDISSNVRFIVGYSGWVSGQLQNELDNNFWVIKPCLNHDRLFETSGIDYWTDEVSDMGDNYKMWLAMPVNPELN